MSIIAREQHTITIDKTNYIITAFDATYGLRVMAQVQKMLDSGETPQPEFVKEVIMKSVTVNNMQLDEKGFNGHFSKKYKAMFELFNEILKFNFGDDEDPNGESDTSE